MRNRQFAEALIQRAREVIDYERQKLNAPETADGCMAPHVALDKVANLRKLAEKLNAMAELASCERS